MKPAETFQKIGFWTFIVTVICLPLFFLPITSDFYDFNKMLLLYLSTGVILISLSIHYIFDRQVRLNRNPFTIPLLLTGGTWLLSSFLRSPNIMETFFEPTQTGTVVALILLFIGAVNVIRSKKEVEIAIYSILGAVSLLALISIAWSSGLMPSIIGSDFMKSSVWTPTGNPFTTLTILVGLMPLSVILILKDKSASTRTLLFSITLFLSIIASGLITYQIFKPESTYAPIFLSQSASWSIALEALKVSPLLGTGPSTYISDFTQFRPLSLNLTPNWSFRFSSANNYYMQILATVGILGLAAYILLVTRTISFFVKTLRSSSESPFLPVALASSASALLIFTLQLILPPTLTGLFILVILLILATISLRLVGSTLVQDANIDIIAASDTGSRTPILPWVALLISLAISIPTFYISSRAFAAETYFQTALIAANENKGKVTYDTLIQAINANPYKDVYRIAYSQTNMMLANTIANKDQLTDDDRNTITQLIQQAIREAKNAVSLNPRRVANLENLASVYRTLINLAQDADKWTLAAYQEAIKLDPANPNLRITLGGIYYSQKNYDAAIRLFQNAVELKPDLANGYYNLASAYREKGDYQNAYLAMQNVLTIVDRNTPDYTKAEGELSEIAKMLPTTPAQSPEVAEPVKSELEAPKPLPTPKITPIELSEDLAPDATPAPSPIPTTPTPQP